MILRFTLTVEDVVDAARLHRSSPAGYVQRIGFLALASLGGFGLLGQLNTDLSFEYVLLGAAATVGFLVVAFTPDLVFDPGVRRSARNHPMVGRPIELEILEDSIHWRSETTWDAKWSAFRKARRSASTLLLYFGPGAALNIPARVLSPADNKELERLIAQNIGKRPMRDTVATVLPPFEGRSDAVELRYTLDAADWGAAMRLWTGRNVWVRRLRFITPAFAALSYGGYLWNVSQGRERVSSGDLAIVIIIMSITAASGFLFPWFMGITGRLAHRRTWLLSEATIALEERGLTMHNSYGKTEILWSTVTDWRENDRVITIFIDPGSMIPIPKRAMDEQQKERILALIRRRVPQR